MAEATSTRIEADSQTFSPVRIGPRTEVSGEVVASVKQRFDAGKSNRQIALELGVSCRRIKLLLKIFKWPGKLPDSHTGEEWRPVVGYEGRYEVSCLGRVRTVERLLSSGRRRKPKVMHPFLGKLGYYRVCFVSPDGAKRKHVIHRLVAEAFIGPTPADRPYVNHIDADKTNNRHENLEYVSSAGNMHHAIEADLIPWIKLRQADVDAIRVSIGLGFKDRDIAKGFGVSRQTIMRIRTGLVWKEPY